MSEAGAFDEPAQGRHRGFRLRQGRRVLPRLMPPRERLCKTFCSPVCTSSRENEGFGVGGRGSPARHPQPAAHGTFSKDRAPGRTGGSCRARGAGPAARWLRWARGPWPQASGVRRGGAGPRVPRSPKPRRFSLGPTASLLPQQMLLPLIHTLLGGKKPSSVVIGREPGSLRGRAISGRSWRAESRQK